MDGESGAEKGEGVSAGLSSPLAIFKVCKMEG